MDRFRLIRFSAGGRPSVIWDFNDGSIASLVRDSLKFTPASANTILAKTGGRFGGGFPVAQTHENAGCEFDLYINGGTSDDSLRVFDSAAAALDETNFQNYLEWRPEGATTSIFYQLRGTGQTENLYRWIEFQGTKTLHGKFTCAVAPLAEGARMTIRDDFSVDSISDYTFLAGAGTISVSGGQLVPSSTATKWLQHSERGNKYSDAQHTLKITTGASTTFDHQLILKGFDINNALVVRIASGSLQVGKWDGGAYTSLNSTAATVAASTNYWLRGRVDGNVVTAEWFTSEPTLVSAPTTTVSHTLSGGNADKYGAAASGTPDLRLTPSSTAERYDDYIVEPFVYRSQTTPIKLLLGHIPGNAPAKVDITIGHSGSVVPFALFGWATRGGVNPPFGIIEAEADTAAERAGWSITADGAARGGSKLYDSSVSGAETYTAGWVVQPYYMAPDEFTQGEIQIEVWGRIWLSSTLVTPKVVVSQKSGWGSGYGYPRYTAEYGTLGKYLVKPSTSGWRFCRLGTLTFGVDINHPLDALLNFTATMGSGSTGTFGLDYLLLVPSRQRALSPTGKVNNTFYPRFINTTGAVSKRIASDLAGFTGGQSAQTIAQHPDNGLGGSQIIFPPGQVDCVIKLSSLVPDDPTSDATSETLSHTATVYFDVIPRYYVARGV